MDPEDEKRVDEQLRELNYIISSLTGTMGELNKQYSQYVSSVQQNNTDINNNTQSKTTNSTAVNKLTEAEKKKDQLIKEQSQKISNAMSSAIGAASSFSQALLSNQAGFEKYGSAVSQAGKASLELGSAFGVLGTILGSVGFGLAKVVELGLKQADGLLKGVDALSDIGSVGSMTTDELYNMAHKMGLNSFTLEKFTNAATNVRHSLTTFTGNAGDGVKKLAQLAAVTIEQRTAFQRMGVNQEELMQRQADYIELQVKSGSVLDKNTLDDATLQKRSLEYAATITVMSTLTGKNAKEAKESMLQARASVDYEIYRARTEAKIIEMEKKGLDASDLRKDLLINDQFVQAMRDTGDAKMLAAAQSRIATGAITETSVVLERMQVDLDGLRNEEKKKSLEQIQYETLYGQANANLKHAMRAGLQSNIRQFGQSMALSETIANKFGGSIEMTTWAAQNANTNFTDVNKEAAKKIRDLAAGKTPAEVATDPAQIARNKMTELEIRATQAVDNMVKKMNPLLGNTGMLKTLALAAGSVAAAFAVIATISAASAISGSIRGLGAKGVAAAGGLGRSLLRKLPIIGVAAGAGYGVSSLISDKISDSASGLTDMESETTEAPPVETLPNELIDKKLKEEQLTSIDKAILESSKKLNNVNKQLMDSSNKLAIQEQAQQLALINKYKFNKDKIANNSEAMAIYSNALGEVNSINPDISGVAEAIAAFEGVSSDVYRNLENFSKVNIDAEAVERNAGAYTAFADAMASFTGYGDADQNARTIVKTADGYFSVDPHLLDFQYFSSLKINKEQSEINAKAFVLFSDAIVQYKFGTTILDAVNHIAAAKLTRLFGEDSPIEAYADFARRSEQGDFGGPRTLRNTKAFLNFAQALGILTGGPKSDFEAGLGLGAKAVGVVTGAVAATGQLIGQALGLTSAGPDSKILNFIGQVESGNNYNKLVGGKVKTDPPLTDMTVGQVLQFQSTMKARGHETTALGKYQIIKSTLEGIVKSGAININDKFNAQTQDKAALQLMNMRGREKFKAGKMSADGYANNLAKEWASLPMANGKSYYAGQGSNKSLVSRNEFVGALQAKKGGLFAGPSDGYAMILHGTEMVIPMETNSVLMKLATTTENMINNSSPGTIHKSTSKYATNQSSKNSPGINKDMVFSLSRKFDRVINTIHSTNGVNKKILRHSTT